MNVLIINCSSGMRVHLCTDDKIYSKIDDNQKKHTDELLLCVDNLLRDAKLLISDIDVYAVFVGPGSFTGVRVAISICKGLAIGNPKAKIVQFSNFDSMSHDVLEDSLFVLEGFSEYVYIRKLISGEIIDDCVSVSDLKNIVISSKMINIYADKEKTQNMLKKHEINAKIAQNNEISCVKDAILKNKFCNLRQITPIYLRASQAEIERNKRLNENG